MIGGLKLGSAFVCQATHNMQLWGHSGTSGRSCLPACLQVPLFFPPFLSLHLDLCFAHGGHCTRLGAGGFEMGWGETPDSHSSSSFKLHLLRTETDSIVLGSLG